MKKYIQPIIIIILIALLLNQFFFNRALSSRYEENIKAQEETTSYYINKLEQEVSTKLSLQFTKRELDKKLETKSEENIRLKEALKKMKKPIVVIQSDQEVEIDTIYVPLKNNKDYQFYFNEKVDKKWFSLNIEGNEKGLSISDFKLQNNQTLVFGWKKKNILSNPELRAEITNTNPYFKQTNIKPIYIVYKRSWYENPMYTIPAGFILGAAVSKF